MRLNGHYLVTPKNKTLAIIEDNKGYLYRRWESNPHVRRHTSLSRARLPVPPLRRVQIEI